MFCVKFTLKINIALINVRIVQNSVVLINNCIFYSNIAFINCLYSFHLKEVSIVYRLQSAIKIMVVWQVLLQFFIINITYNEIWVYKFVY